MIYVRFEGLCCPYLPEVRQVDGETGRGTNATKCTISQLRDALWLIIKLVDANKASALALPFKVSLSLFFIFYFLFFLSDVSLGIT